MTEPWFERARPLLESAAPAVLMTYRASGDAAISPVWFRWQDDAFEVVIAERDAKLRRLERDPRCSLVVFEAVPPFRGVEASGVADLIRGDVAPVRAAISGVPGWRRAGRTVRGVTAVHAGRRPPAGAREREGLGPRGHPAKGKAVR